MKLKLIAMLVLVFTVSSYGQTQIMTVCTPEQLKAVENRRLAASVSVVNTQTQQLQCYYQQLATYWQQVDKDNQQKAKDLQQIAKDKQQLETDARQVATDKVLAERAACLNTQGSGYDEVVAFIECLLPYIPDNCSAKAEMKIIHYNRSGHADGTNPGGQTRNIRGFDNPGYVIAR